MGAIEDRWLALNFVRLPYTLRGYTPCCFGPHVTPSALAVPLKVIVLQQYVVLSLSPQMALAPMSLCFKCLSAATRGYVSVALTVRSLCAAQTSCKLCFSSHVAFRRSPHVAVIRARIDQARLWRRMHRHPKTPASTAREGPASTPSQWRGESVLARFFCHPGCVDEQSLAQS